MTDQWESLTPGQRVAWHRVRRGMPQEVLAGLVGRTVDWLSKIENDRAPLDRLSVIRALADALGVSVFDLIGEPTPDKPTREVPGVSAVRTALTDHRQLSPLLRTIEADHEAPRLDQLQRDLAEVMEAYQASRYGLMLRRLPELITQAQLAAREYIGDEHRSAERVAALANQAAAMILTKLGEADLAWIAAQKGLAAAERSEDPAVIGSLFRSVIHSLHTQDRHSDSKEMTRKAADYLRRELTPLRAGDRLDLRNAAAPWSSRRRAGRRPQHRRRVPGRGRGDGDAHRHGRKPPLDGIRPHQRQDPPGHGSDVPR